MVPTQEALWEPHPGQERLRDRHLQGFGERKPCTVKIVETEHGMALVMDTARAWSGRAPRRYPSEPGRESQLSDQLLVRVFLAQV